MKTYWPLLIMAACSRLWGQSEEVWLSGGTSIVANQNLGSPSLNGQTSDFRLSSGFRAGLRLTCNAGGHIGNEFQYAFNSATLVDNTGTILPDTNSAAMGIHQVGYNVLYYMRAAAEGIKVRAFATAGVHLSDFVLPGFAMNPGRSVRLGAMWARG